MKSKIHETNRSCSQRRPPHLPTLSFSQAPQHDAVDGQALLRGENLTLGGHALRGGKRQQGKVSACNNGQEAKGEQEGPAA